MSHWFSAAVAAGTHSRRGFARRAAEVALVASASLGCTSRGPSEPSVAATRAPVVGGEVSPSGGREDAVVLMRTIVDNAEIVCTATLVAPNLVITARHCVSHLAQGDFRCTVQGELVSDDPGAGVLGMHFDAAGLDFYDGKTPRQDPIAHGREILSTLSDTICVNDLAFVVLDRDVTLPVSPLREQGRAVIGEAVTLVGYGFDDAMADGSVLDVTTQPRTHNTHLTIADVGPAGDDGVTSAPPRSIVVAGPSGCIGDSGGPLISSATGAVLGVYSLLDGTTCLAADARNLFTDVPDFGVLAEQAFTAAGSQPTPETSGSETGNAGAGQGAAGADSGEAGAANAGAASVSNGGGGTGEAPSGGAPSEGGAPSTPTDVAGQGGTPGAVVTTSGGSATNGAGEASHPTPVARPKNKSGCSMTAGDTRVPSPAWLFGLVTIFERVFRVRARVRRRRGLRGGVLRR